MGKPVEGILSVFFSGLAGYIPYGSWIVALFFLCGLLGVKLHRHRCGRIDGRKEVHIIPGVLRETVSFFREAQLNCAMYEVYV